MKNCFDYRYKNRIYKLQDNFSSSIVSSFTVDQTFNGLKKAWRGYTIAKNKGEKDRLVVSHLIILLLHCHLPV